MAIMIPLTESGTQISIDDSFLLEDPIKIPVIPTMSQPVRYW